MKRRASKAELLFAAVVVAVAVGGFAVAHAAGAANPSGHAVATIARDGVAIETIDLDAVKNPYTLRLEDERGVNVVAVEPGRIRVAEADCPDEVCVHTGWIDGPATPIACVPPRADRHRRAGRRRWRWPRRRGALASPPLPPCASAAAP